MADIVTTEQLQNASLDTQTLETFVNGDENTVNNPRLMPNVDIGSIAELRKKVQDKVDLQIATLPSGHKGYATLAAAQAAQASLPANTLVEVTNDSDSTKNGVYLWDGTTLTKSTYDVLGQAKAYADSNPFFKPKSLSQNQDLNTLFDGFYRSPSNTVGNTLLNLPSDIGENKIFTLVCYRNSSGIAYQKIIVFTHFPTKDTVSWERTGNGGSSSFAWYDWVKVVNRSEFTAITSNFSSSITALQSSKAEINLFPNLLLDSNGANTYQAVVTNENGYSTVTMNKGGVTAIFYDALLDKSFAIGNTVAFSIEAYSDAIGYNSGDITIQALTSSGTILATSTASYIPAANSWEKLSTSLVIPENTTKIRFRLINRNGAGNTVCKFRNPTAYTNYILEKYINPNQQTSVGNPIYYVAKTGSDANNGSKNKPFLTIQKAVNSIGNSSGIITVLDSEWYRETVNVSSDGNVTIQSARDKRAKIVGSDKLVLTKSNGYTKVYQASLAAKPTGMGGARGKPMIAEWGTPSSPIAPEDIHHLQRGETYRLPYTEMYEVASIADVEANNGTWFWQDGVIYLSATNGSDATAKQYEARVRTTLSHSGGKLSLHRMDLMFSNSYGFYSTGIAVYREDCRAYSNYHNGFADYANSTVAYRDIALKNGNDGINGTVSSYATENLTTAVQATYFDPYSALNGDDGISYHIRGTCNVYGGLFEYNTKAGVVHVTGGGGNCYNTIARGQNFGFYTATAPLDGRNKSSMHCHGTISEKNGNNYCAGSDGAELYCINTISRDPTTWGYYTAGGKIYATDAKLIGDSAKAKSGTVIINNTQLLT